jgi:hypothetical protein
MIQIECPHCQEPCRMEMALISADECVLRCEGCNVAVAVVDPWPAATPPVALAA